MEMFTELTFFTRNCCGTLL